jgi:hypothetical protein
MNLCDEFHTLYHLLKIMFVNILAEINMFILNQNLLPEKYNDFNTSNASPNGHVV